MHLVQAIIHLVQAVEKVLGPNGLRSGNPHKVAFRMKSLGFTFATKIEIVTLETLVPKANDWTLTTITGHTKMHFLRSLRS